MDGSVGVDEGSVTTGCCTSPRSRARVAALRTGLARA